MVGEDDGEGVRRKTELQKQLMGGGAGKKHVSPTPSSRQRLSWDRIRHQVTSLLTLFNLVLTTNLPSE